MNTRFKKIFEVTQKEESLGFKRTLRQTEKEKSDDGKVGDLLVINKILLKGPDLMN